MFLASKSQTKLIVLLLTTEVSLIEYIFNAGSEYTECSFFIDNFQSFKMYTNTLLIRYVNYSSNQGLLESPYENCLPLPPNLNVLSPAIL